MNANGEDGGRQIKVLVVDDDAMVRAGLGMMLDGASGIRVVGEAADGAEAPDAVARHAPDVVLMDLRMPRVNGVVATRRVTASASAPYVIALTTFDTDQNVIAAIRAGASGFLLKDTPPEQIVHAIARVVAGEPILSPGITRRLLDQRVRDAESQRTAAASLAGLTGRERDVAVAVARGATNLGVAEELQVSVATVKAHLSSALAKLDLDNRTQLALLAHEADLAGPG